MNNSKAIQALIKKAITDAGGVDAVAAHFNVGVRSVRKWWQVGRVPSDNLYTLCEMGSFSTDPNQINPKAFPKPMSLTT
jgi:hypothetical protein